MDIEKLKQWMEIAQKFHGKDFWNGVFDQDWTADIMGEETKSQAEPPPKNSKPFPAVDILKNNRELVILIDLPGISKENLHLSASGNLLYIRGVSPIRHTNMTVCHSEKYYGEFERTIQLPEPADPARIAAKYENGLLEIRFPRNDVFEEKIQIL